VSAQRRFGIFGPDDHGTEKLTVTYPFDKTRPPLIKKLSKVPGRPKGSKDSRPRQRKSNDTAKSCPLVRVAEGNDAHKSNPDQQKSSAWRLAPFPSSSRPLGQSLQSQHIQSQQLLFNAQKVHSEFPSRHRMYGITPARGTSIMETYMFIPLILSLSDDTGAGWRLGWSNS
jgi:hypothetical protein